MGRRSFYRPGGGGRIDLDHPRRDGRERRATGPSGRDLHTPIATVQWVPTVYLLAFASVIPLSGWASARFGAKRVWIASLATFMVGSVLAGLSCSIGVLIGCRVLQGIGGGMIMPVGQAMLAPGGRTEADGPAHGDPRRADAARSDLRSTHRRVARGGGQLAVDLLRQPASGCPGDPPRRPTVALLSPPSGTTSRCP